MNHAVNAGADVGVGQEERSVLTDMGAMGADEHSGPVQQMLAVLGEVHEMAEAVAAGNAGELWSDECMNQLIHGVEIGLAQSWGEVVDAFADAGRVLQSYENGGRADEAAPFLLDSYDLLCAMITDSMNESPRPEIHERWRDRYQQEVNRLDEAGIDLVRDEEIESGEAGDTAGDEPFAFPDLNQTSLGQLKSNDDDLPTLDELPPLESMLGGATESAAEAPKRAQPESEPDYANELDLAYAADEEAELDSAVAKAPLEDESAGTAEVQRENENPLENAEHAPQSAQPSRTVVEFVDRICEELAGLSQRDEQERMLALEMIQGGVAALKREAVKEGHSTSAELCDELMKAGLFVGQSGGEIDERFADLGFGFCGVYVEAMNNPTSENVSEWRTECRELIEEWAEDAAEAGEAPQAEPAAEQASPAADEETPGETPEPAPEQPAAQEPPTEESETIDEAPEEALEQIAAAAEEPPQPDEEPEPEEPFAESPASEPQESPAPVASAAAMQARAGTVESQDLFAKAQEALMRGDGEAAKALALQAAAMIAETEVEKAEERLRDAEARLKANINATEEARSEVKHSEKLVMNAASDVAAGETTLGKAKSHTAKTAHEVEEAQEEVAELERQIAELQAKLEEQMQEVAAVQQRLEEAKQQEGASEEQVEQLREAEKEARKNLEAARQRVKDYQRIMADIESEMEQAREDLSRQRTSLTDINQTINRPEPIKTDEGEDDGNMLF